MSSLKERIDQAQEEWRRGRFDAGRRDRLHPLPETNTKPRKARGGVFYP